jgi:hypothetical protein
MAAGAPRAAAEGREFTGLREQLNALRRARQREPLTQNYPLDLAPRGRDSGGRGP